MPCASPPIKQNFTFGDSIIYIEKLFNVIEKCNADKEAIKEINKGYYD